MSAVESLSVILSVSMLSKKLRLDLVSDDEIRKLIQAQICEIKKYVSGALAIKDREIRETKLAFSAVARENAEVKEDNESLKGELEDCYKSIQDKNNEITNILDEDVKRKTELIECKNGIEENDEKQNKVLIKREIEIDNLHSELMESKVKAEELYESNRIKSEHLENKSIQFDLVNASAEATAKVLDGEKDKVINLTNSFLVASCMFLNTHNTLEYNLLVEEGKSIDLKNDLEQQKTYLEKRKEEHNIIHAKLSDDAEENKRAVGIYKSLLIDAEDKAKKNFKKANQFEALFEDEKSKLISVKIKLERTENDKKRLEKKLLSINSEFDNFKKYNEKEVIMTENYELRKYAENTYLKLKSLQKDNIQFEAENKQLQRGNKRLYDENKHLYNDNKQLDDENKRLEDENVSKYQKVKQQHLDEENKVKDKLEEAEIQLKTHKKLFNDEKFNHESTKTKFTADRRNLEQILENTNAEVRRQKTIWENLANSFKTRESNVLTENKNVIEKVEALRLSEAENNGIKQNELLAQNKVLGDHVQKIVEDNNCLVKNLEDKILNLQKDLADKSRGYSEQTIFIKEKEKIIENLQKSFDDQYSSMKDAILEKEEIIENLSTVEDAILEKEKIIENLQKALDDQYSSKKDALHEKEKIIENLQKSLDDKNSSMKDATHEKETIVENLQKALEEQFRTAEVQNEQNEIYRKEYEFSQAELRRCSLDNSNFLKYFEDGGAWFRNKQEELDAIKAAVETKEKEVTSLALKLTENENKLTEFERESQEKKCCKLCMEDDISTVFLPCGHLCCCRSCANLLAVKNCPICRVEIVDKLRVFQS